MNIQAALLQIEEAGFSLTVIGDDKLSVIPGDQLTPNQYDFIRENKYELIKALSQNETPILSDEDKENIREHLEERVGIQEYDADLPREEAEKRARSNMKIYHYRITDKPDSRLVAIMPGYDLSQARLSLEDRFGVRLLEVKKYSFKAELFK